MAKVCECGCGAEISEGNSWKYKRGHKPKPGAAKAELIIDGPDAPEDEESGEIFVDCQLSVTQIDKVYGMLSPQAKAVAMLTGLNEED